jgi:hypothetical protein
MGCYPLKGEQNIEPPILEAFLFALNVLHLIMQEIERYKQLILSVLRRNLIKRAAIFGSVAKGNFNINSDLDLLVEEMRHLRCLNYSRSKRKYPN